MTEMFLNYFALPTPVFEKEITFYSTPAGLKSLNHILTLSSHLMFLYLAELEQLEQKCL